MNTNLGWTHWHGFHMTLNPFKTIAKAALYTAGAVGAFMLAPSLIRGSANYYSPTPYYHQPSYPQPYYGYQNYGYQNSYYPSSYYPNNYGYPPYGGYGHPALMPHHYHHSYYRY
jgi:hypothetical protein